MTNLTPSLEIVIHAPAPSKRPLQAALSHRLLLPVLTAAVSFLLLATFWWTSVKPFYSPWGDEFSLIVNSAAQFRPSVRSWFFEGFSHYFEPYPHLFPGGFEFIRPVANAVYWVNSLLFGAQWASYLLANYLFHAAVVGVVVFVARSCLKLRGTAVVAVAVLTFLSPALDIQSLLLPSFAFDMLSAAIVLAALVCLIGDRLALAWTLFLVASFTKESSWFAPCAAVIIILCYNPATPLKRRACVSALFPLALLPVWILRGIAFRGHASAYTLAKLDSPMALLSSIARGVLKWPAMPLSRPEVGFGTAWRPELSAHWYSYAALATGSGLSMLFWALLVCRLWQLVRSQHNSRTQYKPKARIQTGPQELAQLAVLLFLAGSLFLPVLGCLPVRFGVLVYPLLFLYLASLLDRQRNSRRLAMASRFILLFVGLSSVLQKEEMLRPQLEHYRYLWNMSRNYIGLLHSSGAPSIITIDDVTGVGSSAESLQRFTGYRGVLIRGSDLDLSPACRPPVLQTVTCQTGRPCNLSVHISMACGEFELRNADWRRLSASGTLVRSLPKLQIGYRFGTLRDRAIAAQDMTLTISGSTAPYTILSPGPDESYVLFTPAGAQ